MENKKKKIDNQKHTGASVFMKILRPEVDKHIHTHTHTRNVSKAYKIN